MNKNDRAFKQNLKGHTPHVAQLANALRELVLTAVPGMKEQVRNGYSVYGTRGIVMAISIHQKHVNLQFYHGTSVSDPEALLIGGGKQLRHISIRELSDIRTDYINRLVWETVELDVRQAPID